jgi:hypothetical protein
MTDLEQLRAEVAELRAEVERLREAMPPQQLQAPQRLPEHPALIRLRRASERNQ